MNFLGILQKMFGNKSQRDMREVMPYVEKIKAEYERVVACSNDELREKSEALKNRLADAVMSDKEKIAALKASVEQTPIEKREKIYEEVDKLEKNIKDTYEKVLLEILPEAFAIVKDTARRFSENETIEVTATAIRLFIITAGKPVEMR